jgi:serine/threonine-protein phosphatase 2B regulatory subunit
MGGRHSTLSKSDMRRLRDGTHFSDTELARLYERFKVLDRDGSGTLSVEEILGVPEFAMNPLSSCLLSLLINQDYIGASGQEQGELNFIGFLRFLSVFHPSARVEEKARLAAELMSGTEGLRPVLEAMVGQHLSSDEINLLVEKTMAAVDKDRDGTISSLDLLNSMSHENIAALMTIKQ